MKLSTQKPTFAPITLTLESIDEVALLTTLFGALSLPVTTGIIANGTSVGQQVYSSTERLYGELSIILEDNNRSYKSVEIDLI